ncbi:DeoR/GlpR family DNA-binding transcription regulator [Alicyclobacillus fastidiosus]|uniref:DeoR/GlpR family DNA-binding transcription regulator n=1 Tax=Alicyclobacillus fastidiosus TaxID=392011 RepID=A0ABY6ZA49_9BACL|nr:DeoR/GlpR family DNA-binding transcription regulator [Alicyclobacillus fastidiosus]WAH39736.1 DeoR/GlpR family DNA-binding transcription regulator [Alicyclobacillus fastidiosus]GMA60967.1 HTH-type transcriptional regulator IolR [Alicyclobacillus fastidiosus]
MLKSKRIKEIQEYVHQHQTVSLDELVSVFDVSKNTIRRDVQWLVERGEIKKVYGGVAVNNSTLVSFNDRKTKNQKQKELIAKEAANFVEDGDIIFIDSGTTTLEMFEYIKHKDITIITNNLTFIFNCLPHENLDIISIGGALERKTNSFASFKDSNLLQTYNINKCFMASTGISITNGVTNASPLESVLKQTAVERSSEVYLLIDHDKFNKHGLITYCKLNQIDYLITDLDPGTEYREYALQNDIQLVIAR